MTVVKKIFSIILLVIFLFTTMGYYILFEVNQSIIRYDMRAMIKSGSHEERIILIKVDSRGFNPNFKKLDNNEFYYFGKLFDIVREKVRGNTTLYYCINDNHEERLVSGIKNIQSFTSASGVPEKTKHMLPLQHTLIILALINNPAGYLRPVPVDFNFHPYSSHHLQSVQSPVPPPPKVS